MALSTRAIKASTPDPTNFFWQILKDLWHPETNPGGYVSLGLAENSLMHDTLREHLSGNVAVQNDDFTYGDGKKSIKNTLARFLNRHFQPVNPIEPSHLTISNGCSSAIEHTAWAFGNPGDVFLLGRPYYGTFVPDITLRMGTKLDLVDFDEIDPLGIDAVEKYERCILRAQTRGERVAGLILANPHNPLGRCYSWAFLTAIMKLCQRHQVNLISDEVYALSTFPNTVDSGVEINPFTSVLSIDTKDLIDPALVHVIWGVSKDFGANGLRLGAIISQQNPTLHEALVPVILYSSTSSMADQAVVDMLSDDQWVERYIEENRQSLQQSYEHVTTWARTNGIEYAPGVNAAFFLWVNLGAVYKKRHPEAETEKTLDDVIMDALLKGKVFIASGAAFGSEKPGWFRIVFTQRREYLDEGLRRIMTAMGASLK
jgi:aspartate/methionine/tyrosine aminotransferase